jgi:predicted transcriptional regulator
MNSSVPLSYTNGIVHFNSALGLSQLLKYRDRNKIIVEILELARDGKAKKTHIMYAAYLSYNQMKEYLGFLIGKGFLEYDKRLKLYKTTEQGKTFLAKISGLGGMLDIDKEKKNKQK